MAGEGLELLKRFLTGANVFSNLNAAEYLFIIMLRY